MKKKIIIILLTILAITLSGCLIDKGKNTSLDTNNHPKSVHVNVIIEETTGSGWDYNLKEKPSGWYDRVTGNNVFRFVDDMGVTKTSVDLALVTEDTQPKITITNIDDSFDVNYNIATLQSRTPRGYPDGGKRVYNIDIIYEPHDLGNRKMLIVHDDFYDVTNKDFLIEMNIDGILGFH